MVRLCYHHSVSNTNPPTMTTEDQITGPIARKMREELGLTQKQFWEPVGVAQSVACRYETANVPVPRAVRILVVARYIGGLEIDASSEAGVRDLVRVAMLKHSQTKVRESYQDAQKSIGTAIASLETAAKALTEE